MSSSYERVVVLRALRAVQGPDVHQSVAVARWSSPFEIARRTPEFMLGTGLPQSRRQPYGERRVRKILAELVDDALVGRRRDPYVGYLFRLTDLGRSELGG